MSEYTVEIEAETLQEAKEQLKSQIPKGFYLLSEQVISDGNPRTVEAAADTTEAAFAKAQSQVPANAIIIEKKELCAPEHHSIRVLAFDERNAESEAKRQAAMKFGHATAVTGINLMVTGKSGFLGIGRTPNQYQARVFQYALVAITYREKARIHAKIGEQTEDRTICGDELKELRDLLRQQKGVLHCLQCGSAVQIDLKSIESEIRRRRELQTAASLGKNVVLFAPDISRGTVCKNCKGVVCGKCSRDSLSRKMEFRNHLEPLIRKHALRQFGLAALLNPGIFEETMRKTLPLLLSPAEESTILCPKCKQELLMGIDHITD